MTALRHPLERLLAPVDPPCTIDGATPLEPPEQATIYAAAGGGSPEWVADGEWQLYVRPRETPPEGHQIAQFLAPDGRVFVARFDPERRDVYLPFDLAEAFDSYVSEAWRAGTRERRLSARQLDLFYRLKGLIPRSLQLAGRRALIRWQGFPKFPAWPLDRSVARLVRFYARSLLLTAGQTEWPFRWFWPAPYRAALVLTHDVESAEGLRLAVELADIEEERGLRSSFNIVAEAYPVDQGVVRELRERGFEVGVHGVFHDRSMFASRSSFEAQLPAASAAAERFGAEGFRSPATHRVFEWLADLPFSYDCSIPHADPFEPQPGGCCTVWPFFIGGIVELPYTMPQDHTLFTLLRRRTIDIWLRQVELIEADYGLVQCVSHPDPGYLGDADKRRLYVEFLDRIADRQFVWKALPRDVARWWRERDSTSGDLAYGTIRGDDALEEVDLEPPTSSAS